MGKTAVLLINLGTPASPDPKDVKKYLHEFLTDGRVIDYPWLLRQLLVRWLIVPRRYRTSAKAYRAIWRSEGSPLMVYGQALMQSLQNKLGPSYTVALGMRYGAPSISSALNQIKECGQLIVLPLYPQYASATTGSSHQRVLEIISRWKQIPHVTLIDSYPTQPQMIQAFVRRAKEYPLEEYDHFLFSFHGLPKKQIQEVDITAQCLCTPDCCRKSKSNSRCYSAQCYATAGAIAKQLGLPSSSYSICFQSRLGKEPWLQPYASDFLKQLANKGSKRLLVLSPSFVCDCLETLYEISIEYRDEFYLLGGEKLHLVSGLNDHPLWIDALNDIVQKATLRM